MDKFLQSYPDSDHFHKVIALHEEQGLEWDFLSQNVPLCPRGWFELSQLPNGDRIEFTASYWLSKLPFAINSSLELENLLTAFFSSVEEIGIYATQEVKGAFYDVHMLYSLKGGKDFFHGSPPAPKKQVSIFSQQFSHVPFPTDYLAFLEIHDGFDRYFDGGVIRIRDLAKTYHRFQQLFSKSGSPLIPFYAAKDVGCYQCFCATATHDEEMNNFPICEENIENSFFDEASIFSSFSHWLLHYLESR